MGEILRVKVPNPFFESDVNVYALPGRPLTLIDSGIGTPDGLQYLEAGLARAGVQLDAVELVILTHSHVDHIGLADEIRTRAGARVLVHEADWADVARYKENLAEGIEEVKSKLRSWQVPTHLIESVQADFREVEGLARSTPAEAFREGDEIEAGEGSIRVIHTPGHTAGSSCLLYQETLFTGDHLLPEYTPNIGAGDFEQKGMLDHFADSLNRLRILARQGLSFLPGHGELIQNPEARIDTILQHHEERNYTILKVLDEGGAQNVFQIASALFGSLHGVHVLLGTGEVMAHLYSLERRRQVHFDVDAGVWSRL